MGGRTASQVSKSPPKVGDDVRSLTSSVTFPNLLNASEAVAARLKETDAMENLRLIDRTQQILHTNAQEALTLEVAFLRLKL